MKAGESVRFDCDTCGHEIEVMLEPKAAGMETDKRPEVAAHVCYCPFCGDPVEVDE